MGRRAHLRTGWPPRRRLASLMARQTQTLDLRRTVCVRRPYDACLPCHIARQKCSFALGRGRWGPRSQDKAGEPAVRQPRTPGAAKKTKGASTESKRSSEERAVGPSRRPKSKDVTSTHVAGGTARSTGPRKRPTLIKHDVRNTTAPSAAKRKWPTSAEGNSDEGAVGPKRGPTKEDVTSTRIAEVVVQTGEPAVSNPRTSSALKRKRRASAERDSDECAVGSSPRLSSPDETSEQIETMSVGSMGPSQSGAPILQDDTSLPEPFTLEFMQKTLASVFGSMAPSQPSASIMQADAQLPERVTQENLYATLNVLVSAVQSIRTTSETEAARRMRAEAEFARRITALEASSLKAGSNGTAGAGAALGDILGRRKARPASKGGVSTLPHA
ncbi:hypothetical protein FA95DRAFT_587780 [Auriscalpium vulgare]|uniref:Uncharacterized protein n=1 Tax=Auriscalpium vulgare TaxID=40419 RepID=A0ACB8RDY3_9AGAM|nr:hypothetical protein FA95DRAFT_587780 [Auriscalpium vulgare]